MSGDVWRNRIVLIVHQLLFTPSSISIVLNFVSNDATDAFIQILGALGDFLVFTSDQRVLSAALIVNCAVWLLFWAYAGLGPCIAILAGRACRGYVSIFTRSGG